MYMPKRSSKKYKDLNLLATSIVDEATGKNILQKAIEDGKNPAAVMLGRLKEVRPELKNYLLHNVEK